MPESLLDLADLKGLPGMIPVGEILTLHRNTAYGTVAETGIFILDLIQVTAHTQAPEETHAYTPAPQPILRLH